ncbi:MAG: hypothetical protein KJ950_08250 [Proteobacteria bacterium]|nr:hypothetical protein [Pseudomonadota bacterium]MBU1686482.1 hypothetical protein [Pseudomonadota bacterium]
MKQIPFLALTVMTIFLCSLLLSCGGGLDQTNSSSTGSLTMTLVWEDSGSFVFRAVTTPRSAPSGVTTIRARITGTGMSEMVQDYTASAGHGEISGVPVGSGLTLTIQGLDGSGNVTYQGSVSNIMVTDGQTYDCGVITMALTGGTSSTTTTQNPITTTTQNPTTTTTSSTTTTTLFQDNTFMQNGLVAYYPFAGNANDESWNGNDGNVIGATLTDDMFGASDQAYVFSRYNQYIDLGASSLLKPMVGSISIWFYADVATITDYRFLISNGQWGGGINSFDCTLHPTNSKFGCSILDGNSGKTIYAEKYNILLQQWVHVVFTWGGEGVYLYVNGELSTDVYSSASGYATYGNESTKIGQQKNAASGRQWQGKIDDVRIYNRQISGTEILALYDYTLQLRNFSTISSAGQVWMDRNLGATRVATSYNDSEAYGVLYQWGRGADGHEKRNSSTTSTLSSSDSPGHGSFILGSSSSNYDWRSSQNNNLWQGVSGVNNPCPAGFRLPTDVEWEAERVTWSSNDRDGAFSSPLKLVSAGYRHSSDGSVVNAGIFGNYWSSTVNGSFASYLFFGSGDAYVYSYRRAYGRSLRCIEE